MPNTVPELLKQVIDGQTALTTRVEQVNAGVTTITTRLDEQDNKIKVLTDAIVGTAEAPGLLTKMALAQDHIKRLEVRLDKHEAEVAEKLEKNDNQTEANKTDLKEVTTKFKFITGLLGMGGGAAGVGIAKLLELLG
jgi:predicted amino acid racemase